MEVRGQGVGRVDSLGGWGRCVRGASPGSQGFAGILGPPAVRRTALNLGFHPLKAFFLYVCVQMPPVYKDTSQIGLGPSLTASF